MTCAPAAARASAVARPMPRDAPVTRAVLLARLVIGLSYGWGDVVIADGHEHDAGIAFGERLCMLKPYFKSMDGIGWSCVTCAISWRWPRRAASPMRPSG